MQIVFLVVRPALLLSLLFLASCATGPDNLVGLSRTDPAIVRADGASIQNLFIATTRQSSDNPSEFFSGERSEKLFLGNVDVTIPRNHELGKIEKARPKNNKISKDFTIERPLVFKNSASFKASLNRALAKKPKADRNILVFVHGYNTNFTDAVLLAAQFVHDTKFKGVPVLFTWASRGRAWDYVYDMNSALQARNYMVELAKILASTNTDGFSVVAHSMGNLVTLESMVLLSKEKFAAKAPLNSIMLASPDIDYDLFVEDLKEIGPLKSKIVVMVSADDRALGLSRKIAGGVSRVGATDPKKLAALGLKVLDVTKIKQSGLTKHSKFADSPDIVKLIGRAMENGRALTTSAARPPRSLIGSIYRGFAASPLKLLGRPTGGVVTLAD